MLTPNPNVIVGLLTMYDRIIILPYIRLGITYFFVSHSFCDTIQLIVIYLNLLILAVYYITVS